MVSACERGNHLVSNGWFLQSERRRAQVQNYFRALLDQASRWLAIVKRAGEIMLGPDIFADCDADFFAAAIKWLNLGGRLEVAVFVENIVGRQERFVSDANGFAALEQRCRVMKRPATSVVSVNKADQQCSATNPSVKLFYDLEGFRNKSRFEDEVLRRITGYGQFGSNNQIRAGLGQSLVRMGDLGEVARQIANSRIDLGKPDFHASKRKLCAPELAAIFFYLLVSN